MRFFNVRYFVQPLSFATTNYGYSPTAKDPAKYEMVLENDLTFVISYSLKQSIAMIYCNRLSFWQLIEFIHLGHGQEQPVVLVCATSCQNCRSNDSTRSLVVWFRWQFGCRKS